jgi:hypothetical protein
MKIGGDIGKIAESGKKKGKKVVKHAGETWDKVPDSAVKAFAPGMQSVLKGDVKSLGQAHNAAVVDLNVGWNGLFGQEDPRIKHNQKTEDKMNDWKQEAEDRKKTMPEWGSFAGKNKQPTANLNYNPRVTDEFGRLKDPYRVNFNDAKLDPYSVEGGTKLNSNAYNTNANLMSGDYNRGVEKVGDLERVNYQNFDAYRAMADNQLSEQVNSNYQGTLDSLRSQGGLSAADRLAAGQNRGRDMAKGTADVNVAMAAQESDNIYKTDMYNSDYANRAQFEDAEATNQSYQDNQRMMFDKDKYNADSQTNTDQWNSQQQLNADTSNVNNAIDWNKYNSGLMTDAEKINAENSLDAAFKNADGTLRADIANKDIEKSNYDTEYNHWADQNNGEYKNWMMANNIDSSVEEAGNMYRDGNKYMPRGTIGEK